MDNRVKTAVVVGAGPVGCLAALSLAKMGWQVEIYESRPGERPRTFLSRPHQPDRIRSPASFSITRAFLV